MASAPALPGGASAPPGGAAAGAYPGVGGAFHGALARTLVCALCGKDQAYMNGVLGDMLGPLKEGTQVAYVHRKCALWSADVSAKMSAAVEDAAGCGGHLRGTINTSWRSEPHSNTACAAHRPRPPSLSRMHGLYLIMHLSADLPRGRRPEERDACRQARTPDQVGATAVPAHSPTSHRPLLARQRTRLWPLSGFSASLAPACRPA